MKWPWRKRDEELDEEIRAHMEMSARERVERGASAEEARAAARREFGNVGLVKETTREVWGWAWLERIGQDVRYGLRMMRRSPGFTIVAVLTLALGIGATTSVFSVVDRILFRGLPYTDGDRLVTLGFVAPVEPLEFLPAEDYVEWRARNTAFAAMTSWTGIQDCDLTQAPPDRLSCVQVESTFLPTFGVEPLLGRNFTREEDRPGAPKVALLFYHLWRGRFGGDPQIVGKTVSLDGQPTTILGVLPPDFELPNLAPADFLVPQELDEAALNRSETEPGRILRVFARLKPGVSIAQAKASPDPSFQESVKWVPPGFRTHISLSVRSLRDREIGDARVATWVLFGAVLAVLLIACANVANLLLARAATRQREFAIRTTLGAGRVRLLRQTLIEGLLLAVAGAALGCAMAFVLLRVFIAISPAGIPRLREATLDFRVVVFTLVVSTGSGIFFGLASGRQNVPADALHGRTSSDGSRRFLQRFLVAAQIGVSFVLLAGAGLLLRSLSNLERTPLGINSSNVLFANISLNPHVYSDPARQLSFFNSLEQQLSGLPGVSAFALSDSLPPSGRGEATPYSSIEIPGRPHTPRGTGGMVGWSSVTPGYFSTLGIPILKGRAFADGDRAPDAHEIILIQELAGRLFPGEDPLGKSLRWSDQGPWQTVIGIAGDVRYVQGNGVILPAELAQQYYVARKHSLPDAWSYSSVILRTSMSPAAVGSWMRMVIASLDPTVPVTINRMSQRVGQLEARPRFNTALLGIFAAMGVLLAAIGTYGVLSFFVVQRTHEIGVRAALGAQPRDLMKLILGEGAKLVLAGVVAGMIGATAATRLMTSLLFGVTATDPWMFVGVTILLTMVALAACYIPARRATRVDPMVALRYE
jgi:putative ABC transport system permease protein